MLENALPFLLGAVAWFIVQNMLLPDRASTWLAQTRNSVLFLIPVAVILLLVFAGTYLTIAWQALQLAFKYSNVPLWVPLAAVGAVLILIVIWLVRGVRPARTP